MREKRLLAWLESLPVGRWDEVFEQLTQAVLPAGKVKDALSGTWLGHALHPPLTDFTLGAWIGASLLDLMPTLGSRRSARRLVGLGIVSSVPTALAGLADWTDTTGSARRLGVVHGAGNVVMLQLFIASWLARRVGQDGLGRVLGLGAMGLGLGTAWLGGHLLMREGVAVDQTVFLSGPSDWKPAAPETDLREGGSLGVEVDGVPVLLARRDGEILAIAGRCSHRGGPLHEGALDHMTVTCPWHGSVFCLSDGSLESGPATAPQPSFETRVRDGAIEIRASG